MTPMVMTLACVRTLRREVWRHCECCDELAALSARLFASDDAREAMTAFLNRRR